jgi:uncharacterized phiE125 gp8 family phage protein
MLYGDLTYSPAPPIRPLRLVIDPLPPTYPAHVDIACLFDHLRLASTHGPASIPDEDELILSYLKAAILWAENTTHRTIIARAHRWILADFPQLACQAIHLPRGNVRSITAISYSRAGVVTTVPAADYVADLSCDDCAVVMPTAGTSWPSIDYDAVSPVTIEFVAGYEMGEIPADIQHAIFFAVTDFYELRGSGDLSMNGRNLQARESLIGAYRLERYY